ncbi:MAG: DnaJ domain-containing protein [Desulfobacterales bacterium]|jgi:curved DNA-binding protein CbpA
MNPYDRLEVATDANDETIRTAYLAAIKRFPPDRFPEQFTSISEAYQTLKDEDSRLRYLLFEKAPGATSPMDAVRSHFVRSDRRNPPDFETLKDFLRRCATR